MEDFTKKEKDLIKKLNTPAKIQDYLDTFNINFEMNGDTCRSPLLTMRSKIAHCIEGAMLAAFILSCHGYKPLLLDLRSADHDYDHVVAIYKINGYFGAISKTNHAVLRYREPVYKTIRELAMSYFHEYFLDDGEKTMRSFSEPFDLSVFNNGKTANWVTTNKNLWYISKVLDNSPHENIAPRKNINKYRKANKIEIEAGKLVEWKKGQKKKLY